MTTFPSRSNATQIEARSKLGSAAFETGPQEPLLYAALRAGIAAPYECATGTCGTCKARRVSGVIINDWPQAPGCSYLKPERDEVLLCQTRALGACTFEIPGSVNLGAGPRIRPRFGQAELTRFETLAPGMAEVHLQADEELEFEAGQFVVLRVPRIGGYRAYSMANAGGVGQALEFVVKRKPGGAFTEFLFDVARPGDRIEWFGPIGKATFDPREQRTILCIAGGSGIASILSILEAGCATRHFEHFDAAVFFGVRTSQDLIYLDRVSGFAAEFPGRLDITIVLSHDTPNADIRRRYPLLTFEAGFPHEIAARELAGRFAGRVAYLAGPPILVDVSIRMLITQARLPARDIRYDKFS